MSKRKVGAFEVNMTDAMDKQGQLFAKTAAILREQQSTIRGLRDENTKLAQRKDAYEREQRVRGLAKQAIDRGIIDGEYERVEEWVKETLASSRSLDVVEQGIEYAPGVLSKESSEDESSGSLGRKEDPISSLILGAESAYED